MYGRSHSNEILWDRVPRDLIAGADRDTPVPHYFWQKIPHVLLDLGWCVIGQKIHFHTTEIANPIPVFLNPDIECVDSIFVGMLGLGLPNSTCFGFLHALKLNRIEQNG